jgi:apolipoprotein N-acyltransferase
MEMITVLNTIPATGPSIITGVAFVLFAIVLLALMIFMAMKGEYGASLWLLVGTVVFCLLSLCAFTNNTPVKYECTINEGVDFKVFTDTFKVDDQRGEIYTVYLRD